MRARRNRQKRPQERQPSTATEVFKKAARRQGWIYVALSVMAAGVLLISVVFVWITIELLGKDQGARNGRILTLGAMGLLGFVVWTRLLRPGILLKRRISCPSCGGDARLERDNSVRPAGYQMICGSC